jgi:hypothetical protein
MKQTKVQEPKANKKNKNSSKVSTLHGLYIYKHHIKNCDTSLCIICHLNLQSKKPLTLMSLLLGLHPHNNQICLATYQWLTHNENFAMYKNIVYKI